MHDASPLILSEGAEEMVQAPRSCHAAGFGTRARGLRSAGVTSVGGEDQLQRLLAEQIAYYRALAGEYDDHALDLAGVRSCSRRSMRSGPTVMCLRSHAALGSGQTGCCVTRQA